MELAARRAAWAETNWSLLNHDGDVTGDMLRHGGGERRLMGGSRNETSIRPGWFYHETENEHLKSLSKLMDIYYKSVGRNSCLLLHFDQPQRTHTPC